MKARKMKPTTFANLLIIGLVLTVAATGCKKKPVNVTPLPGARAGAVPEAGPAGQITPERPIDSETKPIDTSSGIPAVPAGKYDNWIPHPEILQADTVYFDFDSSVVKASEKPKVAHVVEYLKANPGNAVRVEGHCDERGTEEYNRALGERRASALREEIARQGVDPIKVDTISFGKDRPADAGHNEAAWTKNRRGVFIVLTPP